MTGAALAILIGGLFRMRGHDFMQLESDAQYFYENTSETYSILSVMQMTSDDEYHLPLFAYSLLYSITSSVGLGNNRAWGILLNAVLVILANLTTLIYASRIYPKSFSRLNPAACALAFNGGLMLFSGIHLRDAFSLFITTVSVIINHPGKYTLVQSSLVRIVCTIILTLFSFLTRTESIIIPPLVFIIGIALKIFKIKTKLSLIEVLCSCAFFLAAIYYISELNQMAANNFEQYRQLSNSESLSKSRAFSLLYELPNAVTFVTAGAITLFGKVPIFSGAFYDAYSFFLSINAAQMLFIGSTYIGLMVLAISNKLSANDYYIYIITAVILTLVGQTSCQVRHFMVVYPFIIVLYIARGEIVGQRIKIFYISRSVLIFLIVLNLITT